MSEAKPERKLLRLEIRNSTVPIERKPEWIRTTAKMGPEYQKLQSLVKEKELHTVCQEAGCPNIFECWEDNFSEHSNTAFPHGTSVIQQLLNLPSHEL